MVLEAFLGMSMYVCVIIEWYRIVCYNDILLARSLYQNLSILNRKRHFGKLRVHHNSIPDIALSSAFLSAVMRKIDYNA